MSLPEAECGTPAGANRHRDLGEPPCDGCTSALARYRRRLRAQNRGGDGVTIDCEDFDLPNQWELPNIKPAPDPAWAQRAACAGKPTDWWFPETGGSRDARQALDMCATCPVQAECLQHAIRHNERHGIWGGRSERQRQRLRSASRRGAA